MYKVTLKLVLRICSEEIAIDTVFSSETVVQGSMPHQYIIFQTFFPLETIFRYNKQLVARKKLWKYSLKKTTLVLAHHCFLVILNPLTLLVIGFPNYKIKIRCFYLYFSSHWDFKSQRKSLFLKMGEWQLESYLWGKPKPTSLHPYTKQRTGELTCKCMKWNYKSPEDGLFLSVSSGC